MTVVATRSDGQRGRLEELLASPAAVLGAIGLYVLVHFLVRFAVSPTLGLDDSEQSLFSPMS